MKERITWVFIILCLIVIALLLIPSRVGASDGLPDNIFEWVRSDGSLCSAIISEGAVALDCDCPCGELCAEPTVTPKETHTPVPTLVPTDKPKCNSGRGNDSEGNPDCDPGNSGEHNKGGD